MKEQTRIRKLRLLSIMLILALSLTSLVGCGSSNKKKATNKKSVATTEEDDNDRGLDDIDEWPSSTSSFLGKRLEADLTNRYFDMTDVGLRMAHGKRARANIVYKNTVTIQIKGNVKVEECTEDGTPTTNSFKKYVQNYSVKYDSKNKITNLSFKLNKTGNKLVKGTQVATIKAIDTRNNAQVLIDVYKGY